MKDALLGLPVMRDEDMPPGWLTMRDTALQMGISPFDGFCSQDMPGGGQAYWRICREEGGGTAMALVHGSGEHPVTTDEALTRLFRGPIGEVRGYLLDLGVDVDGDPLLRSAFKTPGDA